MLADEVIPDGVERHHVNVRGQLLPESIREPGEAAHRHTNREVLAFNVAGGDMLGVRIAHHPLFDDSGAFRRAVAASARRAVAVNLDELGIIHIAAESPLYCVQIDLVGVGGDLDLIGQAARHVLHEVMGGRCVPVGHQEAHQELRIGIQRRPRPSITSAIRSGFGGGDGAFLGIDEAPNLIASHALGFDASDGLIMKGGAGFAGISQQLRHGVDAYILHPRDGTHGGAFHEEGEDFGALGNGEFVQKSII